MDVPNVTRLSTGDQLQAALGLVCRLPDVDLPEDQNAPEFVEGIVVPPESIVTSPEVGKMREHILAMLGEGKVVRLLAHGNNPERMLVMRDDGNIVELIPPRKRMQAPDKVHTHSGEIARRQRQTERLATKRAKRANIHFEGN